MTAITHTNSFENWFESAQKQGLVDIKLAITNSRGASVRAVQDDMMNIDALVKAQRTKELPLANIFNSEDVDKIINNVSIY